MRDGRSGITKTCRSSTRTTTLPLYLSAFTTTTEERAIFGHYRRELRAWWQELRTWWVELDSKKGARAISRLPPNSRAIFERYRQELHNQALPRNVLWRLVRGFSSKYGGATVEALALTTAALVSIATVAVLVSGSELDQLWWLVPTVIVSLVVRSFGRGLTLRGEKHLVKARLPWDMPDRPIVLYLRSFLQDTLAHSTPEGFAEDTAQLSFEQRLAKMLNDTGPVWAVGIPGERLPTLGANRIYFQDDQWEQSVKDLMSEAMLVVVVVGASEYVRSELDWAFTSIDPTRILIVFQDSPYSNQTSIAETAGEQIDDLHWGIFLESAANAALPKRSEFPDKRGRLRFVRFRANWKPKRFDGMDTDSAVLDELKWDLERYPPRQQTQGQRGGLKERRNGVRS